MESYDCRKRFCIVDEQSPGVIWRTTVHTAHSALEPFKNLILPCICVGVYSGLSGLIPFLKNRGPSFYLKTQTLLKREDRVISSRKTFAAVGKMLCRLTQQDDLQNVCFILNPGRKCAFQYLGYQLYWRMDWVIWSWKTFGIRYLHKFVKRYMLGCYTKLGMSLIVQHTYFVMAFNW